MPVFGDELPPNNRQADASLVDDRVGRRCEAEEGVGCKPQRCSGFTLTKQLDFVACSNWQITRVWQF